MRAFARRKVLLGAVTVLFACSAERPFDRGADAGATSSALRRALYDLPALSASLSTTLRLRSPIAAAPDHSGRLVLRRSDSAVFFGEDGLTWSLSARNRGWGVRSMIVGARPGAMRGDRQTGARVNNYLGDNSKWTVGEPAHDRVVWEEVRPGVDMLAEQAPGGIAYRFVLSPGAKLADLAMAWEGVTAIRAANDGRGLELETGIGTLRVSGLRAFSVNGTQRTELAIRHVVEGNNVTFAVDGWDGRTALVIDPTVSWGSFLGGAGNDTYARVAIDGSNNIYVVGTTQAPDFPTMGGFDTTLGGAGDAFVTKISPTGALLWSTYLGGSGYDAARGIAIAPSGDVVVTGEVGSETYGSSDFPVSGSGDKTFGGSRDGFVTKLSAAGTIVWSSFLGGSNTEDAVAVATDSSGNVFVTGNSYSNDFATSGAFDTTLDIPDAFVAKLSAAGVLLWASYLGGTSGDSAEAIATDASGNVIVVGTTDSDDYPTKSAAYPTFGGTPGDATTDAFISKFDTTGALLWSTFLGKAGSEQGKAVATDASGNVFVAGSGASAGFPAIGGFDTTSVNGDAFIAKFTPTGTLAWSSFLGGNESGEEAFGIAVNSLGNVTVTGHTYSSDFPISGAFDTTKSTSEGFVTHVSSGGSLLWSSFIGGGNDEGDVHVAVDKSDNLVIVGFTSSWDFAVPGGFDTTIGAGSGLDSFVTKLTFLAKGATCTAGAACVTGYCVDGVCCDKPCSGSCEACTNAKKGSGADGTCGNVAADTDPKSACAADSGYPNSCKADGMCDGAGACRLFAKLGTACGGAICAAGKVSGFVCNGGGTCADNTANCAPFACDALGKACRTTCTVDTECADTAFCGTTGACTNKKANGESCGKTNECQSGHCADGVCCNSACTGQCESCSETATKGTCTPVKGSPVGGRTACSGSGTCAGSCDGVNGGSCSYPIGTVCGETCSAGTETISKCDAMGACTAGAPQGCNGLSCEASTRCKTACLTSADCESGFTCAAGKCAPTQCSEDGKSVLSEGKETSCSPALCKGGKCVESCSSSADCAAGFVCNPSTTKCEAPPAANEDSGGCAVGGRGGSVTGVALLALALLGHRRRARV